MFPPALIEEIRNRISIVTLVGEYVPLKKAGRNFRGLCPFHAEKTPSFMVNDEKGIFHCFGCGEGGNAFRFLMRHDGLSFVEAVRHLAERAHIELPAQGDAKEDGELREEAKRRKWALRLNQVAAEYFCSRLIDAKEGEECRNYLKNRGFSDSSFFRQHLLGYADDSWDGLVRYLTSQRVPLELAAELGLIREKSGSRGEYYDFFRHRLMFPILSHRDEIVGFSGRVIAPTDTGGKYVNSPDSMIYNKSRSLFGLGWAVKSIRHRDQAIVVEGNMDVLSLHRAGIENVVAPLGTAFTADQARLLRRFTTNVVVMLDADAAGEKAAERMLEPLLNERISATIVTLPEGLDPDSWAREVSAGDIQTAIESARSMVDWYMDRIVARYGVGSEGRIRVVEAMKPIISALSDSSAKTVYVDRLSERLVMDRTTLVRALTDARRSEGFRITPTASNPSITRVAEQELLAVLIREPALFGMVTDLIGPDEFRDPRCVSLAQLIWSDAQQFGSLEIGRVLSACESDEPMSAMVRQLALSTGDEEVEREVVVNDCVTQIREGNLREELELINGSIREAESRGDMEHLLTLMTRKQALMTEWRKKVNQL